MQWIYEVLLPRKASLADWLTGFMSILTALCQWALVLFFCVGRVLSSVGSCDSPCSSVSQGSYGRTQAIDEALASIASDDYLLLKSGCHCVGKFIVVSDVTNVTIAGDGEGVFITCAPGLGLAFLNVTGLSIQRLTIIGCGLNGPNLVELSSTISTSVDLFLKLYEDINVAMLIASSSNLTMENVTISNTTGFGLLAINVAGTSKIVNSTFSFNKGGECFRTTAEGPRNATVGGGATFIYVDYINVNTLSPVVLNIHSCVFSYNSYCGLEYYFQLDYELIESLRNHSFTVGAGGGLSLYFAQQRYGVDTDVESCDFENNTSAHGSAAAINWYEGLQDTHVTFTDCTVAKNGIPLLTRAGIGFLKDIAFPNRQTIRNDLDRPNTLSIIRTLFKGNYGITGSGLEITSRYLTLLEESDSIMIESSRFENNFGVIGAAVYGTEFKYHGIQKGIAVRINNCTFTNNIIDNSFVSSQSTSFGTIHADTITLTVTNSSFISNVGTALSGQRASVNLGGEVRFYNNNALTGGAMRLVSQTFLVVRMNSLITFVDNAATISGGAIYVDYLYGQTSLGSQSNICFLYFDTINIFCNSDFPCSDPATINISMVFTNNKAPLGGTLYGSTLDGCPWASLIKKTSDPVLIALYKTGNVLQLDKYLNSSTVFSTPVQTLEVTNSLNLSFMPGQMFNLKIRGADGLNQNVPTIVTTLSTPQFTPRLGDSGYWLTSSSNNIDTPTRVYGQRNITMNITVYSLDTYVQSMPLGLNLTDCAFGFEYNAEKGDCQCSKAIMEAEVTCDPDLKVFSVPNGYWLGPSKTGVVYSRCIFDYCRPFSNAIRTIHPLALDDQCADYRTGLLCGSCKDGYSAVFGSNRCMKCSNNYLSLLILFAAAGVGIIALISFLHITISDGYINGVLFYVSILSSYEVHLRAQSQTNGIFIPLRWMNLDIGFESCFYNGMTSLDRAGLNFVFPIYLFTLMSLFICIAGRSHRLSDFLARSRFSPSKLLATLITLSYNNIAQSCFQILGFTTIKIFADDNGYTVNLWFIDPNVKYFSALHTFLFIVSLILLICFVLLVPILLLLPSFTFRLMPNRLKPLYDAFIAPLKIRFAFWIGLRFCLRIVYFIISSFAEFPLNILLLGVGLIVGVFINDAANPLKSMSNNVLDMFFYCNLLLLTIGSFYFNATVEKAGGKHLGYVIVMITTAYFVIFCILMWHIYLRFPWLLCCCKALYGRVKAKRRRRQRPDNKFDISKVYQDDPQDNAHKGKNNPGGNESKPLHIQDLASAREPLLEEFSVSVSSA